jgi:hypothetical protein
MNHNLPHDRILDVALAVIARSGACRMTLEAVAIQLPLTANALATTKLAEFFPATPPLPPNAPLVQGTGDPAS